MNPQRGIKNRALWVGLFGVAIAVALYVHPWRSLKENQPPVGVSPSARSHLPSSIQVPASLLGVTRASPPPESFEPIAIPVRPKLARGPRTAAPSLPGRRLASVHVPIADESTQENQLRFLRALGKESSH